MKHGKPAPSVDTWIEETKRQSDTGELGMVLVHRGIVRTTSKAGGLVTKMNLTYDAERLDALLGTFRAQKGITEIRVWINEGELAIGDDSCPCSSPAATGQTSCPSSRRSLPPSRTRW